MHAKMESTAMTANGTMAMHIRASMDVAATSDKLCQQSEGHCKLLASLAAVGSSMFC